MEIKGRMVNPGRRIFSVTINLSEEDLSMLLERAKPHHLAPPGHEGLVVEEMCSILLYQFIDKEV